MSDHKVKNRIEKCRRYLGHTDRLGLPPGAECGLVLHNGLGHRQHARHQQQGGDGGQQGGGGGGECEGGGQGECHAEHIAFTHIQFMLI